MNGDQDRIECESPTPGKKGTRIVRWKYDLIRSLIRKAVPKTKAGIEFKSLSEKVRNGLSTEEAADIGSVSWYVTTVKLDLEVKAEIERVQGAKPQKIRRLR